MATTTITTTSAEDARIVAAFGDLLGLTVPGTNNPRNATAAEVKGAIRTFIVNTVRAYETRQAQIAAAAAVATDVSPT